MGTDDLLLQARRAQSQGNSQTAVQLAWLALQEAGEDWAPVAEAYLLLGDLALSLARPVDALNFSVGALVAATAIADSDLKQSATDLRSQVEEHWGELPARALARSYQVLL